MKIQLSELDHLLTQQRRGILKDKHLQKKLKRLLVGKDGEKKVVALLKKYLPPSFKILCNVWLEVDGVLTEVDILVVTSYLWWVIEVKNYEGNFEYRDSCCFINQLQIPDQVAAFRNRLRIVNQVTSKMLGGRPVVLGSMVFINELCQVTAEEQPDFKLLMNYQFIWQIQEMVELYHQAHQYIGVEDSLTLIRNYRTINPYLPSVLPAESLYDLKTGVNCPACFSYELGATSQRFFCQQCDHKFFKYEGLLRTASDLGVLYFNNPKIITTKNVWQLSGQAASKKRISAILKQNLAHHGKARNSYFYNNGLPYDFWIK